MTMAGVPLGDGIVSMLLTTLGTRSNKGIKDSDELQERAAAANKMFSQIWADGVALNTQVRA